MDRKRFQSEIMQELADEAPPSPADEPLDEADAFDAEGYEDEGYEEDAMDDAAVEEMNTSDEGGDESLFEHEAGSLMALKRIGTMRSGRDKTSMPWKR